MSDTNQPPDDERPPIKIGIENVEMTEYLFSNTAANFATFGLDDDDRSIMIEKARNHIRGAFRLHRFVFMNWLLMNGVKLPVEVMDDRTHPEVGDQRPDQPSKR